MVTFKLIEAKIQQTALCYFGKLNFDDKTKLQPKSGLDYQEFQQLIVSGLRDFIQTITQSYSQWLPLPCENYRGQLNTLKAFATKRGKRGKSGCVVVGLP